MPRRLALLAVVLSALSGCASLPPPEPTETELTYLVRHAPAAALDSIAAWAADSPDLGVDRSGAGLSVRDLRPGQDNHAAVTTGLGEAGTTAVTVRARTVVVPRSLDLGVALFLARRTRGDDVFGIPLADPDSAGAAPCFSLADWLAGDEPSPPVWDDGNTPPELIGGLAGLQRRVQFPEGMRRAGVSGSVLVEFVVGKTGAVECAQALASPHPAFTSAVLAAVRASAFRPGTVGGEPVSVRFIVPLSFALR